MALSAYSRESASGVTMDKSSEELIGLLLDKACVLIRTISARIDTKDEDLQAFANLIEEAVRLVLSLRAVLDLEQGGEVAQSLNNAYSAIASCLFKQIREANKFEVEKLLTAMKEIRDAWYQSTEKYKKQ